ncbi:hypothetical protein GH733_013530 [Mirounga leonina]|nr:hypothetical protein GH733_013530 [Mirounga leonina]
MLTHETSLILPSIPSILYGFRFMLLGFTFGNVVGMYLAQNYDVLTAAKRGSEFSGEIILPEIEEELRTITDFRKEVESPRYRK